MLRVGKHVMVVYAGSDDIKECEPAVVRYKLKIDGVSVQTTPAQSDIE